MFHWTRYKIPQRMSSILDFTNEAITCLSTMRHNKREKKEIVTEASKHKNKKNGQLSGTDMWARFRKSSMGPPQCIGHNDTVQFVARRSPATGHWWTPIELLRVRTRCSAMGQEGSVVKTYLIHKLMCMCGKHLHPHCWFVVDFVFIFHYCYIFIFVGVLCFCHSCISRYT